MSLRILSAADLTQALPMSTAIAAMRDAFSTHAHIMPLRTAVPIIAKEAVMLSMPAYLPLKDSLGVKIVSVFPHNTTQNLPVVNGFVMLIDAQSGLPQALLNGAALTAIRTGSLSGLATDLLARQNAKHLAVLGSGPQALTQIEAVCCVRPIASITLYSRQRANAERLAQQLATQHPHFPAANVVDTVAEASQNADIICTATAATEPLLHANSIKPGTHINAIGSHTPKMQELSADLLANAQVFVDQREAALAEAGEIIAALTTQHIALTAITELGELLQEPIRGRKSPEAITIFKSVGLAIQDVSAAACAFKQAEKQGIGQIISF